MRRQFRRFAAVTALNWTALTGSIFLASLWWGSPWSGAVGLAILATIGMFIGEVVNFAAALILGVSIALVVTVGFSLVGCSLSSATMIFGPTALVGLPIIVGGGVGALVPIIVRAISNRDDR